MEALYMQPLGEDGVMMEQEEQGKRGEQDEGGMEASSPTASTTDEETDEDSEPERPPVVRRKVSFADAFGLNLVSVKEFDNAEETESEVSLSDEREATLSLEEFYMCCRFTVPSSPEELDQRLQAQMLELESIEILPGTTTLRGIIRVVNLCFSKCVHARISLDRWKSYFDLLAEYVPGSSDRKTDRFTFRYTVLPPFEREGTRVEFCLRYETSVGTFWANNKEMNYVLFCHQKGHVKEHGPHMQEERSGCRSKRSKRSCLRANRNGGAEDKTREALNTATAAAALDAAHKAQQADRRRVDRPETQLLYHEERKRLVESVKSRHKATRLARVQDYLSQRRQQAAQAFPHDSASGQRISQLMPAPWGDSASSLHKCQQMQPIESPPILTYHEIPLLTLDWNDDKPQQWGAADVTDIWTGRGTMTLSHASEENTPSANDTWETFRNGADNPSDKESSACDVWQAFLSGPSYTDHSGVPESEWLQTAASVSPSSDKEPQTQYAASSDELREFQAGTDTPTTSHAHTFAACQLLSDTCGTLLANVALNTEDHQSADTCVTSPREDNTATQDASQRSQTTSVTDTPQECSLEGAPPVSEDCVDSSAECHMHMVLEGERGGIIGGAEGIGGDEPFTPHTADFVTSSGESGTTDMTAMPESQNASAVDRISQEAGLAEGLSSSGEGEVTGTAHNAIDDMLAFRETIRQGTKDGVRCVFSTSRQGAEEMIATSYVENKVSAEEEIFRPQESEECESARRYADETLNQNSAKPLQGAENEGNEMRPAQSHAGGLGPDLMCQHHSERSKVRAPKLNEEVPAEVSRRSLISAGVEMIQVLGEQRHDEALQLDSPWQTGNTAMLLEVHDEESRPVQAGEEPTGTSEHVLVLNQTGGGQTNPSARTPTVESTESNELLQSARGTFSPRPTEKCNPNPSEVVQGRGGHSQEGSKGQNEAVGSEISSGEVTAQENAAKKDTSMELQAETSEGIEGDASREDKGETVSIGKLKIEAMRELMGNVESPRGERKNALAELKEQELSAEVESSPRVECEKLSDGTKDPITAESTAALEVMEPGLEEMFIQTFGEDLIRGGWEEVFGQEAQASNRLTNIVEGMGCRLMDTSQDCRPLGETGFSGTPGSGVLSSTETDPDFSPCQGLERTLVTAGSESPEDRSPSLTSTGQTLSELQAHWNSRAHLSQDLAAQSRPPSPESARGVGPPKGRESYSHIKERSVARQETGRQTEDCGVHKESLDRSAPPAHKHRSPPPEKLKESAGLGWWSVLYILSHVTRLLICALLVGGFFLIVFLYDFPAFFAVYVFSVCWWFYKWRRHPVMMNKEMVG